jgi:hypothetical protein
MKTIKNESYPLLKTRIILWEYWVALLLFSLILIVVGCVSTVPFPADKFNVDRAVVVGPLKFTAVAAVPVKVESVLDLMVPSTARIMEVPAVNQAMPVQPAKPNAWTLTWNIQPGAPISGIYFKPTLNGVTNFIWVGTVTNVQSASIAMSALPVGEGYFTVRSFSQP